VLCLHGLLSPATLFLPLAERLASRYRVLIPDLPGYGRSTRSDATFEAVGQRIVATLEACGVGDLRAIVGFSSGGYRALHLVARLGITAEVIVLIGGMADLDAAARKFFTGLAALGESNPTQFDEQIRTIVTNLSLSEAWRDEHPDDVARVTEWSRLAPREAIIDELRAIAAIEDLRPKLPPLNTRLYLRVGELDATTPPIYSQAIVDVVPSVLDVVPGCGHALFIENAAATIEAIASAIAV
jgi:pimeloyl-ACP methyl ester carboxylesterase